MPNPATATEVFGKLISGIGSGHWRELADLYAPDAVVDQPMMSPRPGHIEGRDDVRTHFEAAARGPFELRPRDIVVHTTGDPELVIAEFNYDVRDKRTGRETAVANVQVVRVRDGLIVATRDYHDHQRLAALADSNFAADSDTAAGQVRQ